LILNRQCAECAYPPNIFISLPTPPTALEEPYMMLEKDAY
jgi:hypothetical protein